GVDAAAVDVAHVKPVAELRRIGVAVEIVNAAVGGLLMPVLDDRAELPGERRIGATLAMVVAGLDQVPEMVDHAGADEEAAFGVDGYAPGIAGSFAEQLELAGLRMDAEQRAREAIGVAVAALDGGRIEDAVEAIEPAVRPPGERVGQLVGVGAA